MLVITLRADDGVVGRVLTQDGPVDIEVHRIGAGERFGEVKLAFKLPGSVELQRVVKATGEVKGARPKPAPSAPPPQPSSLLSDVGVHCHACGRQSQQYVIPESGPRTGQHLCDACFRKHAAPCDRSRRVGQNPKSSSPLSAGVAEATLAVSGQEAPAAAGDDICDRCAGTGVIRIEPDGSDRGGAVPCNCRNKPLVARGQGAYARPTYGRDVLQQTAVGGLINAIV